MYNGWTLIILIFLAIAQTDVIMPKITKRGRRGKDYVKRDIKFNITRYHLIKARRLVIKEKLALTVAAVMHPINTKLAPRQIFATIPIITVRQRPSGSSFVWSRTGLFHLSFQHEKNTASNQKILTTFEPLICQVK